MKEIALITGASGGIGGAIVLAFAKAGYGVAMQYHTHPDKTEEIANAFSSDVPYQLLPCDLTDCNAVEAMINTVHQRLGTVSVLVNCAGKALQQMIYADTTDEDADNIFRINVLAPMRLTRLLYDDIRTTQGSVIQISSMWGVTGASCEVIYSASKAALIGFTKSLAKELAPSGATVNCIAPGFIPTAMNQNLSAVETETFREETPLQRLGTPQDIAEAALYLARAKFMTGQVLSVDGGIVI